MSKNNEKNKTTTTQRVKNCFVCSACGKHHKPIDNTVCNSCGQNFCLECSDWYTDGEEECNSCKEPTGPIPRRTTPQGPAPGAPSMAASAWV